MFKVISVNYILRITAALLLLSVASWANAQLIAGDLVVYDEDRDITWIRQANSGQGRMTFVEAQAFAGGFTELDGTDWRLPDTPLGSDPGCTNSSNLGDNCTESELGHMYYTELGNSAGSLSEGGGLQNRGPFVDFDDNIYWSDTQLGNGDVIVFNFFNGFQTTQVPGTTAWVWLVHNGKLAGVPYYFWMYIPIWGWWIIAILMAVVLTLAYWLSKSIYGKG